MPTFSELTDEVLQNLQSDSLDQAQQTSLTFSIDEVDLSITVDEPQYLSQGLIEIEDELLWAKTVDTATGIVTVSPAGRGYRSTTAATHAAGAFVLSNPRYSRHRVKQAINTAIRSVFPDIYRLVTTELDYVGARLAYELPAAVESIHKITWESVGPSRVWIEIDDYVFVPDADTTVFPSGKALYLWDGVIPGRTVRVTYIRPPAELEESGDDFVTVTGLPITAKEVIVYGACYRLLGYMEAPRLQQESVESSQRSMLINPGSAANAGKYFYALYQESLAQEREGLLRSNPSKIHRTRRVL